MVEFISIVFYAWRIFYLFGFLWHCMPSASGTNCKSFQYESQNGACIGETKRKGDDKHGRGLFV
jgi:hypothetical protein